MIDPAQAQREAEEAEARQARRDMFRPTDKAMVEFFRAEPDDDFRQFVPRDNREDE